MKSLLLTAAAATASMIAAAPTPAVADGPRASSGNTIPRGELNQLPGSPAAAHYEWQYHYVGRHARLEGYWAIVK